MSVQCYICGQFTGTASIGFHLAKCAAAWRAREVLRVYETPASSPSCRQARLPLPDGSTSPWPPRGCEAHDTAFVAYNREASAIYERDGHAFACGCGRRFVRSDAWRKHTAGCGAHYNAGDCEGELTRTSPQSPGPARVQCHIFGQFAGTASIGFHLAKCAAAWCACELLRVCEASRAPSPPSERHLPPDGPDAPQPRRGCAARDATLVAYNREASAIYERVGRAFACGCGRICAEQHMA